MKKTLLLNADLGEGMPGDKQIIAAVDMANIAAGAHAGGGDILRRAVSDCRVAGVSIGAHPSYPDKDNFGRVSLWGQREAAELSDSWITQLLDVAAAAESVNGVVSYIKPHGALYHDIAHNWAVAEFFAMTCTIASNRLGLPGMPALPIMVLAGSTGHKYLIDRNYPVIAEAFADRAYQADGSLVPRTEPGSVIEDSRVVLERVHQLLDRGTLPSVDGADVAINPDTICVHGDTPQAARLAHDLRALMNGRKDA